MKQKLNIMSVFGTRPEAIKMCPLICKIQQTENMKSVVCVTAQHRAMLDQVLQAFEIRPDYDLDIMRKKQTLTDITIRILSGMEIVLEKERPDIVLVHGDTTTSFAAALAAFYKQIPVGHVEAGLRTNSRYSPFPEEMNRQMVGRIAELHFAATLGNRDNLIKEGITKNIFLTGNTVIDAMKFTVRKEYQFQNDKLNILDFEKKKTILLTAHRRENIGLPLRNICTAAVHLVREYEDIQIVFPVHPNPAVRQSVYSILEGKDRIILTEPLCVSDMHNLLAKSYFAMTDSGGIQEEAAALGIPLIILRRETERTEAIQSGSAILGGCSEQEIYNAGNRLLSDQKRYQAMSHIPNPYGDGFACEKIVHAILNWSETTKGRL